MTRNMLRHLETLFGDKIIPLNFQSNCLLQGVESKTYKPLMNRDTCGNHSF